MSTMNQAQIDRFKVVRQLGKRLGFTIFEAVDLDTAHAVCLKLFDPDVVQPHTQKFLETYQATSALESSHIYQIHDYGIYQDQFYAVSELPYTRPLSQIMQEEPPFSHEQLAHIFAVVSRTLRLAHLRGVVHGLLNPECIFIEAGNNIKIDDFGLYWLGPYLSDREFFSIWQYVAPEVYERTSQVDGRVDIYSVGALLDELVTDGNPDAVISTVDNFADQSDSMRFVVSKCLQLDPNARYVNAKQLLSDLVRLNGVSAQDGENHSGGNGWSGYDGFKTD